MQLKHSPNLFLCSCWGFCSVLVRTPLIQLWGGGIKTVIWHDFGFFPLLNKFTICWLWMEQATVPFPPPNSQILPARSSKWNSILPLGENKTKLQVCTEHGSWQPHKTEDEFTTYYCSSMSANWSQQHWIPTPFKEVLKLSLSFYLWDGVPPECTLSGSVVAAEAKDRLEPDWALLKLSGVEEHFVPESL